MKPEHIEDILVHLHPGQWFGWSDAHNKVYANLVIYGTDEKPTQAWLESELTRQQEAWDAEQATKQETLASAKAKLGSLGLTAEEVKEAFGI
jgi:replicative DNA helicase